MNDVGDRLVAAVEIIRLLVREPSTLSTNLAEAFLREEKACGTPRPQLSDPGKSTTS